MPDITGVDVAIEVIKLIKAAQEEGLDIKEPYMCCCTAYTDKKFRDMAFEAGMQKFVNKPVKFEDLDEILINLQ